MTDQTLLQIRYMEAERRLSLARGEAKLNPNGTDATLGINNTDVIGLRQFEVDELEAELRRTLGLAP